MSVETEVSRQVYELKELVKVTVANDLLEARSSGRVNLDEASLRVVFQIIDHSLTVAVDKTVNRVSNAFQSAD
jgi:hypothetical protein